jgi:LacI family transcriptional regulator
MAKATFTDIVRATGLSKNAVSLALRDSEQISPETRERVKAVATRLGYQANPILSQLMAQIRVARTQPLRAKLALVNANFDPEALRTHPTIPTYMEGCESRAAKLGYAFDHFWLHDRLATTASWKRRFKTRGIKGIILVGLMHTNHLPGRLEEIWRLYPSIVTGVRTRDPALSFACVDHHHLVLSAFERALALGYKRPALVIDDVIEALVEHRFSAGFFAGQNLQPGIARIPIFSDAPGGTSLNDFREWFEVHRPDVIFTLYNNVIKWLGAMSVTIPRDVGIIQLEWRAAHPEIAGMNQHNRAVGEAAVDMLVTQINHNEVGVQDFPRATLVGAAWMDGASVRAVEPSRAPRSTKRKRGRQSRPA